MTLGKGVFRGDLQTQQNAFRDIQSCMLPGLPKGIERFLKQPTVQEGLVILIRQIRPYNLVKKATITVIQEEIQFVTGEL